MIKALIIDDEAAAANVLQLMIERHIPEITQVRLATKISEAHALLQQFQPQIVFLDIMMPEKNGFEFLNEVKHINFEIIFTTAYDEFAIRAIRFSALDYLLKPLNAEELRGAVTRYLDVSQHKRETDALLKNLLQNLAKKEEEDFKLAVPTTAGAVFFSPANIVRLEGEGNYTRFFLNDGRKHVSSKTMKEYEEILLQHNFLRIHKSHLVNKNCIEQFNNEGSVVLKDKTLLPVSRQRKQQVAAALKK
ncbi:MAG TPA: LytTR family DNA-binding domain-containing protein [Ferruginibacter sp.]|nr:LytTR family DNA-binding domain-containing protein [Ferruginibacter sp.]HPH92044.1 LytTR family DNA-binding domain-containing protein [Ferruginibacter sp.]